MKKFLLILLTILGLNFSVMSNGYAQLSHDMRYIRGVVLKIDGQHHLTIKEDQTGAMSTFDIKSARQPKNLQVGQEVFVIAPLKSNIAKSIRLVVKKR